MYPIPVFIIHEVLSSGKTPIWNLYLLLLLGGTTILTTLIYTFIHILNHSNNATYQSHH